jgi:hypothetical protein
MGNRYFPGTAMGGRLYPEGIGNWGPWDRSRLVYTPVTIWIREGLEDVAQKLWEHPKAKDQNDIDAQRDI